MTTAIRRRRGTTTQHSTFTGLEGEVTVDTTKDTLVVHDGSTAGGHPLAKENNATLAGNVTLSGGTANGVAYLNGSKVVTTGSALYFDGTSLGVGTTSPVFSNSGQGVMINGTTAGTVRVTQGGGTQAGEFRADSSHVYIGSRTNGSLIFEQFGSEGMRLTSTGLGIGTTSPAVNLDVSSNTGTEIITRRNGGRTVNTYADGVNAILAYSTGALRIGETTSTVGANFTERARIDSSGNLGLGVTPSAWGSSFKALQVGGSSVWVNPSSAANTLHINRNAYYDGSSFKYIATGTASEYSQDSGSHIWYTAASGTAGNAITFTQAMTLDASGNLLVGTTTTSSLAASGRGLIEVNGTSDSAFAMKANGTLYGYFFNSASEFRIANITANPITFFTNNTERARIDSSGNLLVGKTSTAVATGAGFIFAPAGDLYSTMASSTGSAATLNVYSTDAGAYRFYVSMNGTVSATNTTITAISDQRLKENIRDLDDGLATVMALKPRKFDWKDGKGKGIKNDRGFIAQEFEQVLPDMIEEWRDPAPEGEEPYKAINANLIPTLVKAIQELKAEFDAYKATHP